MSAPGKSLHKSILKRADDTRARIIIYGLAEAARQLRADPETLRQRLHTAGLRIPRNAWKRWATETKTITAGN